MKPSARIILGLAFLLWLPGWSVSLNFWPVGRIDEWERLLIAIALSLAIVPVLMFVLAKSGIAISATSTVIETLVVIVAALAAMVIRNASDKP